MKKIFIRSMAATTVVAGILAASPVHAAPRQYVVVVAEGLSPQILDLGKAYLRKADEDPETTTAFDDVLKAGQNTAGNSVADLKGLLETAEANGYKTGLVSTAPVTTVAPLFYNIAGTGDALTSPQAKFDFLAGAGASAFTDAQIKAFSGAGNTYIADQAGTDNEIKGRVLAVEGGDSLSYALDRNPEQEAGLAELTSLAIDTLGEKNEPFVLIVHDNLIKKAVDTKDAPAVFEQYRELNSVLSDVVSRREDNPALGLGVLWTGGATPRFSTTNADEINNSYFILANLGMSYAGAAKTLKGADEAKLAEFADPTDGTYKGWKLTPETRSSIVNGNVAPEAAIRASYEPAIKLSFDGPQAQAGAETVGFDAPQGIAAALKSAVSQSAPK